LKADLLGTMTSHLPNFIRCSSRMASLPIRRLLVKIVRSWS